MSQGKTIEKKHKKAFIALAALVVVGVVVLFVLLNSKPAQAAGSIPESTTLVKMELEQAITANGSIRSTNTRQVTSNLTYKITNVLVKEGDVVTAGDLLCELDITELEKSISTTQQSISSAVAQDKLKMEQAERKLQDAINQHNLEQIRLDGEVNTAVLALNNAKAAETDALIALNGAAALVAECEAVLQAAQAADAAGSTPETQAAVQDAVLALDATLLAMAQPQVNHTAAAGAAQSAQLAYEKTVSTRDVTLRTSNLGIESSRDTINTLKLSNSSQTLKTQLEAYQRQKEDAQITAPISGTITAVSALVGASPGAAGMSAATATATGLFSIEDLGSLEITAYVPEYDAVNLRAGLPVDITTDALEAEEWSGTLKLVSLTADSSGNFTVTIGVTSAVGRLSPGMSAKMNIIVESKKDVYAVPYDAVVLNASGETVVYAWEGSADAASGDKEESRREIVVETGMESDYYIEIVAPQLNEGLSIINDPMKANTSTASPGLLFSMGGVE